MRKVLKKRQARNKLKKTDIRSVVEETKARINIEVARKKLKRLRKCLKIVIGTQAKGRRKEVAKSRSKEKRILENSRRKQGKNRRNTSKTILDTKLFRAEINISFLHPLRQVYIKETQQKRRQHCL